MASEKGKPKTPGQIKPPWPVGYTPRVVVKFRDNVQLPDKRDVARQYVEDGKLGPWQQLAHSCPGITIDRLITALAPQELRGLVDEAIQSDPEYRPSNFLNYFVVTCSSGSDPRSLAKTLALWETVQLAYVESGPTHPPVVNPSQNPYWPDQTYLLKAPAGIDAEYAWGILGGDGGGPAVDLKFCDLEEGWAIKTPLNPILEDHEDLPAGIPVVYGVPRDYCGHGTAVLGIVCAVDNNVGCIGITPNVAKTMVASVWTNLTTVYPDPWNAITVASKKLGFGDVLLLEYQFGAYGVYDYGPYGSPQELFYSDLPVEVDDYMFTAIKNATARGVVVVEAAGNGGLYLDHFAPDRRYSPNWSQDSGAIMVAAATSGQVGVPDNAYRYPSNFGNRIDCYARGENLRVIGDGYQGYSAHDEGGRLADTSGATAIIAGATLAVQGIAQANLKGDPKRNYRFSPNELRSVLNDWTRSIPSDPTTGNTLSGNSTYPKDPANPLLSEWNADNIGVMPDLRNIIDKLKINAVTPPSPPGGLRVDP